MPSPLERTSMLLAALAATSSLYGAAGIAGSSLGLTPAALAQAAPGGGEGGSRGGNRRFGQMLEKLGLSDAQKSQIRGIMKSARDQNQNVTDPAQRRANMRAAFQKIQGVLTPEQRAKLQAMRPHRGNAPH